MNRVRVGGPKDFWNRIKSISVQEIAREANRPLSIAVVGQEESRNRLIELLHTPSTDERELPPATVPGNALLQVYSSMHEEDGFPTINDAFDFVIDVGGGRVDLPVGPTIYSVDELGGLSDTLDRILADRTDLALALARNFPVFRKSVAQIVIQQTAMTNAEFSLITGVASAFPLFELVLPANALSDIVVLTKNQIMMVLRLAAAFGLEVDYKSRMKELTPILINAFSWRAIARELVGAVPMVGFVFRAMISYAGTITVGRAAQLYYESGETITRTQAQRLYKEAYAGSKDKIRVLAGRVRLTKGKANEIRKSAKKGPDRTEDMQDH